MYKLTIVIFCLLVVASCGLKKDEVETKADTNLVEADFLQGIIDSAGVSGSILVYGMEGDIYFSNDFAHARKGFLPASTFKIVNSIIALETGVVEDDSSLFVWDGEDRALDVWEQDLYFRDAFHFSCVPCYQEIARGIGVERMQAYLDKLDYGDMVVDSSTIDVFWLEGESQISQFEQVDFLKRFFTASLPISERSFEIMRRLMLIEANAEYRISGKTGWSIREGHNNGWFVGYIEKRGEVFFFATNVEPKEDSDMDMFPMIRKEISYRAFEELGIL